MLSVKLIATGKMKERFYIDALEEYKKRLGAYCRFECAELPEQKLPQNPSSAEIDRALSKEAAEAEKNIPDGAYVIAMCVEGDKMTSEALAARINSLAGSGRSRLCFIIGSSYGLSPEIKSRADMRLSMSAMTFPHHLARVMLAEQIYRAFKINEGSQYHK